ncbi:MAG: hypothetical protein HYS81_04065 [Candidatus Aenigmatarchaeota archaeon]|nr:MAG: hypothetical protein HYS81_04065 [Candidatus Aenigmarchaeota archaeon]
MKGDTEYWGRLAHTLKSEEAHMKSLTSPCDTEAQEHSLLIMGASLAVGQATTEFYALLGRGHGKVPTVCIFPGTFEYHGDDATYESTDDRPGFRLRIKKGGLGLTEFETGGMLRWATDLPDTDHCIRFPKEEAQAMVSYSDPDIRTWDNALLMWEVGERTLGTPARNT